MGALAGIGDAVPRCRADDGYFSTALLRPWTRRLLSFQERLTTVDPHFRAGDVLGGV